MNLNGRWSVGDSIPVLDFMTIMMLRPFHLRCTSSPTLTECLLDEWVRPGNYSIAGHDYNQSSATKHGQSLLYTLKGLFNATQAKSRPSDEYPHSTRP